MSSYLPPVCLPHHSLQFNGLITKDFALHLTKFSSISMTPLHADTKHRLVLHCFPLPQNKPNADLKHVPGCRCGRKQAQRRRVRVRLKISATVLVACAAENKPNVPNVQPKRVWPYRAKSCITVKSITEFTKENWVFMWMNRVLSNRYDVIICSWVLHCAYAIIFIILDLWELCSSN